MMRDDALNNEQHLAVAAASALGLQVWRQRDQTCDRDAETTREHTR